MAGKHSFQCKLTGDEYDELRLHDRAEFSSPMRQEMADQLTRRGLLMAKYEYAWTTATMAAASRRIIASARYCLTRRGELMLQRANHMELRSRGWRELAA